MADAAFARMAFPNESAQYRAARNAQLGAVIAHNPQNLHGRGSCIFMHLWQGENVPTSGCTAMSEENLRSILMWLDPAKDPRLVQLVRSQE